MRRITASCTLLLVLLVVEFPSPVEGSPNVELISASSYRDPIEFYHVVGEVQNTGNVDVFARAEASFYDASNSYIINATSPTEIGVLLAGRRAPFDVVLTDRGQSMRVDHYNLRVTFGPYPGLLPLGLEILSNSSSDDPLGFRHISGVIRNIGLGRASSAKVVSTFYNSTGNVVVVAFSPSDPNDIGPGQQALFDIKLTPDRVSKVHNYTLTADSAGYGLISSHPYNTFLVLAAPSTTRDKLATLQATLRDDNRSPLTGERIDFSANIQGAWEPIGSSMTNGEGQAVVTYVPRVSGKLSVEASYAGTGKHSPSRDRVVLAVGDKPRGLPTTSLIIASVLQLAFVFPLAAAASGILYLIFHKSFPRRSLDSIALGNSKGYNLIIRVR